MQEQVGLRQQVGSLTASLRVAEQAQSNAEVAAQQERQRNAEATQVNILTLCVTLPPSPPSPSPSPSPSRDTEARVVILDSFWINKVLFPRLSVVIFSCPCITLELMNMTDDPSIHRVFRD